MKVWYFVVPIVALSIAGGFYDRVRAPVEAKSDFVKSCTRELHASGYPTWDSQKTCGCIVSKADRARQSGPDTDISHDMFDRYFTSCAESFGLKQNARRVPAGDPSSWTPEDIAGWGEEEEEASDWGK